MNLRRLCSENFNFPFKMKGMWAELANVVIWWFWVSLSQSAHSVQSATETWEQNLVILSLTVSECTFRAVWDRGLRAEFGDSESLCLRVHILCSLRQRWLGVLVNLRCLCSENFNFSFKMKGMWAELAEVRASPQHWMKEVLFYTLCRAVWFDLLQGDGCATSFIF